MVSDSLLKKEMKQIVWHVTFWFYGRCFSIQKINSPGFESLSTFVCAAIVSGGKGTAQDKIKTLREAGVTVVESPAKMGVAMLEAFKQKGLIPA